MATSADVIKRYLENHVNVRRNELVLAVDNHFGEGWFRHNYINRTINEMVNAGSIECWNTRYCLPRKREENVITGIAQQIRKCVEENPGCYNHQIVVAVRTMFGRHAFSHDNILAYIALEVEHGEIFSQNGQYYNSLNLLQHEELLSLACGDSTPKDCLLYTSPSPRDRTRSRMPSSA